MFVFRKIWRALLYCNSHFEIRPLPFYRQTVIVVAVKLKVESSFCVTRTFSKVGIREKSGKDKYLYQWDRRQPNTKRI